MSKQQTIAGLSSKGLLDYYRDHPGDAPYVGMELLRRIELDEDILNDERESLENLREEVEELLAGLRKLQAFLTALRPDLHSIANMAEVFEEHPDWDKAISGFDRHMERVQEDS